MKTLTLLAEKYLKEKNILIFEKSITLLKQKKIEDNNKTINQKLLIAQEKKLLCTSIVQLQNSQNQCDLLFNEIQNNKTQISQLQVLIDETQKQITFLGQKQKICEILRDKKLNSLKIKEQKQETRSNEDIINYLYFKKEDIFE